MKWQIWATLALTATACSGSTPTTDGTSTGSTAFSTSGRPTSTNASAGTDATSSTAASSSGTAGTTGTSGTSATTGTNSSATTATTAASSAASTGTSTGPASSTAGSTTGTTATSACTPPLSTSTSTGTSGASGTTTGGFVEPAHAAFPDVPNGGGPFQPNPVLSHLQLITITFGQTTNATYPLQSEVEAFGDWIVGSPWLARVGADYGVGYGTHVAKIRLADAVPTGTITDSQIRSFLTSKINDGTLPAPGSTIPCTSDTLNQPIYAIYYPQSVSITDGSGSSSVSCTAFGGYHSQFSYTPAGGTATSVSYAVLPSCPEFVPPLGTAQSITIAASHEIIEAATDPFPWNGQGTRDTTSFEIEDEANAWFIVPGEVGDLCTGSNYKDATSGYWLQQVWSNSLADLSPGTSPCAPSLNQAYTTVSADTSDTQIVSAGATVTYHITAWSDRTTTGKWPVLAYLADASFNPSYTFTTADGQSFTDQTPPQQAYVQMGNGDTATLTFTIPSSTPSQNFAAMQLISYWPESPTFNGQSVEDYNVWPIALYVQ